MRYYRSGKVPTDWVMINATQGHITRRPCCLSQKRVKVGERVCEWMPMPGYQLLQPPACHTSPKQWGGSRQVHRCQPGEWVYTPAQEVAGSTKSLPGEPKQCTASKRSEGVVDKRGREGGWVNVQLGKGVQPGVWQAGEPKENSVIWCKVKLLAAACRYFTAGLSDQNMFAIVYHTFPCSASEVSNWSMCSLRN